MLSRQSLADTHSLSFPVQQESPYLVFHNPMPNGNTSPYNLDPAAVDFRAFYPYTPNEVKHRKRTTSAQLKVLETVFKRDTKPNASLRTELAAQLDMTARGVQVRFPTFFFLSFFYPVLNFCARSRCGFKIGG